MVGSAIVDYLDSKVKWTSLDPVRIGYASVAPPHPVIVWIGIVPGFSLPKTASRSRLIARASFLLTISTTSTVLGLSISAEATPYIEGTGEFCISDPRNPGKIYLVTARHIVLHPDKEPNVLYQHRNPSQRRRNVLLLVDAAAEKHITTAKSEIRVTHVIIEQLERRLGNGKEMDEAKENSETKVALPKLEIMRTAIGVLEEFSADVSQDWKRRENRIFGHVVLSPPHRCQH